MKNRDRTNTLNFSTFIHKFKLKKEKFDNKITTTIEVVKNYCPAEEYHQKYIEKKYSFLNI